MRLIDLLMNSSRQMPDRTACVWDANSISYRQWAQCVQLLSQDLVNLGCGPGVNVALVLNNSVEYLVAFFAVSAAGATLTPLAGSMTGDEIRKLILAADVSVMITNKRASRRLTNTANQCDLAAVVNIQCNGAGKIEVQMQQYHEVHINAEHSNAALMVPTSGSASENKIVMHTDLSLISNMLAYREIMRFTGTDTTFCALSMHHIYAICAQILTHTSLGDTFVVYNGPFLATEFFKHVERCRVTISALVPSMAVLLAEYRQPERFDLGSLQRITLSGARTPKTVFKRLLHKYPTVRFISMYGMTEAGSRIALAASAAVSYPIESVGRPLPGVSVRIVDRNDKDVPADTVGQIVIKSSGLMMGYYKQPALTAQTLVGGCLHTGDLGYLDGDGNLFVVGRIKDNIISGGNNIEPLEVEECIREHAQVLQVAIVAKKDALLEEVPCAFVVKIRPDQKLETYDIVRICQAKLSSYKVPREVRVLEKLPLLPNCKIDRRRLRQMANSDG